METKEQTQVRIDRTLKRVQAILSEEQCELEPLVLIVSGNLVKKEINVVAKPLIVETKVEEVVPVESEVVS